MLWKQHGELRTRFLLCQFLPLTGIFFFFSLNKAGKENWPAPGLLAGVVLLVVFWRPLVARLPKWRWAVYPALGLAGLMTVFGHNTDLLGLPPKLDPLRRAKGWDDFAAHVQAAREKHRATLLIGNHYDQASMMAYYLPDHPRTFLREEKYGKSQFSLWPGYNPATNSRALYVTTGLKTHSVPAIVQRDFPKCEVVDEFETQHHGRPVMWFTIYLCQRE